MQALIYNKAVDACIEVASVKQLIPVQGWQALYERSHIGKGENLYLATPIYFLALVDLYEVDKPGGPHDSALLGINHDNVSGRFTYCNSAHNFIALIPPGQTIEDVLQYYDTSDYESEPYDEESEL